MAPVLSHKEPTAFGISPRTARAVADPWRLRILTEVGAKPLSPSQFVDEFGGELTHVSRCFRHLAKWGYIEIAEERPGRRRGAAIEHVYRAVRRAYFDTSTWESVPRGERDAASRSVLSNEAIEVGTFDADSDRHLSWKSVLIDRAAWTQIGKDLDEVLAWLPELETQSLERTDDVETLIPTTVGLAAFRSPGQSDLPATGPAGA